MLKQKYFLADIFILSAEKQPIKLSWRKIVWLPVFSAFNYEIKMFVMKYYFNEILLADSRFFSLTSCRLGKQRLSALQR